MEIFTWILAAAFGLATLVTFSLSFSPRYQGWVAERYARSVALILTPELLVMVRSRVAQRTRGTTIGGLAGMLVGLAVLSTDPSIARLPLSPLLWVGVTFAGLSVGAAIAAAASGTRLRGDSVRYARAEAVGLNDYVAPIERHGARIAVSLAVAVLLVSLTLSASGLARFTTPLPLSGSGLLAMLSIAALALFEADGRWLVRRGQPAGSPAQLSWDDALRSMLLRDLITAPIALGTYGFILGLGELSGALAAAGANPIGMMIAANIGFNAAVYAGVLVAIFVVVSKPQRYFRRRLWPELAEGL